MDDRQKSEMLKNMLGRYQPIITQLDNEREEVMNKVQTMRDSFLNYFKRNCGELIDFFEKNGTVQFISENNMKFKLNDNVEPKLAEQKYKEMKDCYAKSEMGVGSVFEGLSNGYERIGNEFNDCFGRCREEDERSLVESCISRCTETSINETRRLYKTIDLKANEYIKKYI
jgi:hypothetical protein